MARAGRVPSVGRGRHRALVRAAACWQAEPPAPRRAERRRAHAGKMEMKPQPGAARLKPSDRRGRRPCREPVVILGDPSSDI
jgi:hypothetical protein